MLLIPWKPWKKGTITITDKNGHRLVLGFSGMANMTESGEYTLEGAKGGFTYIEGSVEEAVAAEVEVAVIPEPEEALETDEAEVVATPDDSGHIIPVGGSEADSFFLEIPLGHEHLEHMKRTVSNTTRKQLVGREFIKVYGPIGAGAQSVPWDTYLPPEMANIDMLGESGQQTVHTQKRLSSPSSRYTRISSSIIEI